MCFSLEEVYNSFLLFQVLITMTDPLEVLTEEELKKAIEELKQNPENICLHFGTKRCDHQPCLYEGYSGILICGSYINKRHLESFEKYRI